MPKKQDNRQDKRGLAGLGFPGLIPPTGHSKISTAPLHVCKFMKKHFVATQM